MRQELEKVEIIEPPIKEFEKKEKSCVKKSCTIGCICVVAFLVGSLVLLKFAANPKPKELKAVPDNIPSEIPIYDQQNIEVIKYTSGESKAKEMQVLSFLPKLLISPIVIYIDEEEYSQNQNFWQKFIQYMKKPAAKQIDSLELEWTDMDASPDFIQEFYINELEKNNFNTTISSKEGRRRQFSFEKENIKGLFFIEDNTQTPGTEKLIISFEFPPNIN